MSAEDIAQDVELRAWELNNVYRRQMVEYKPGDAGYGPEECESCGESMPVRRREMGRKLCTECQSLQERKDRMHRN